MESSVAFALALGMPVALIAVAFMLRGVTSYYSENG